MVPGSSRHRLIAFVLASLVLLAAATGILASVHHDARESLARAHADRGAALADRGALEAAVSEYRAALSLERGKMETERALALALLSLDRVSEAESYLRDLLQRDPTSGPLNRGMARIHARRGRDAQARVFYNRAVYGEWPGDPAAARLETRFELLEFLMEHDARDDALVELLQLKAELRPQQSEAIRRVADQLVQVGAPQSALELLREGAAAAPKDVELLAHLARHERAAGETSAAVATLRRALGLEPKRQDLRDQLTVDTRVLALDPMLPRLRMVERTRRARQVLEAVASETRPCLDEGDEGRALLREAARHRARRATASAERAEQEIDLALRLWTAAPACRGESPEARALAAVMERLVPAEAPAS